MATAAEKRAKVVSFAPKTKGRNIYSQNAAKRECVFTPYKDGRYYSDCSSFVRWLYRMAQIITNIGSNTVSILRNKAAVAVECKIKNGVPTDIAALRVGDLLMFAGSDSSRAYAEYVGHVEMVYAIKGNTVTLIGHGSGHPSTKNMVTYCRARQAAKTGTKRGNKGLIRVLRFIPDDMPVAPAPPRTALSVGMVGEDVRAMQQALLSQGYKLPRWGADGEYGSETKAAVASFQKAAGLPVTGQAGAVTLQRILAHETAPGAGEVLVIASVSAHVRKGPGTNHASLGTVKRGARMTRTGEDTESWFGVWHDEKKGVKGYISGKMAEVAGDAVAEMLAE